MSYKLTNGIFDQEYDLFKIMWNKYNFSNNVIFLDSEDISDLQIGEDDDDMVDDDEMADDEEDYDDDDVYDKQIIDPPRDDASIVFKGHQGFVN